MNTEAKTKRGGILIITHGSSDLAASHRSAAKELRSTGPPHLPQREAGHTVTVLPEGLGNIRL